MNSSARKITSEAHHPKPSPLPTVQALQTQHPELFEKSDAMGFLLIFQEWAQIFAFAWIAIWANHWIVTSLAIVAIGFKQFVLSEIGVHLASHGTLFRTRALNKYMEFFISVPFLRSVSDYRAYHMAHHRDNSLEQDPVYLLYNILKLDRKDLNPIRDVLIAPFSGRLSMRFLFVVYPRFLRANTSRWNILIVGFYAVALCPFILWGHWNWFILYWIVPFVWLIPAFTALNEIAEHYKCTSAARQRVGVVNYFLYNDGYHYIHHAYPSIAWFRLKQASHVLAPHLEHVETCRGFFLGSYLRIKNQTNIPYVPKHPNPAKQSY